MAVPELGPGLLSSLFRAVGVAGEAKARTALQQLGAAVERQAKINASSGSHKYGTRTPARPGSGPAVISGTLRRSIVRTQPVPRAGGWELKVGTKPGQFPPYGKTPSSSSRYGLFLETGLRNGVKYPFLGPAARFARTVVAPQIYQSVFRPLWPRI